MNYHELINVRTAEAETFLMDNRDHHQPNTTTEIQACLMDFT
jgi:hypothetical protein